MADEVLRAEIETRLEDLGFELVEFARAGSSQRPILRLRIDRQTDEGDSDVSLDDCARVSRALEAWLDQRSDLSNRYVLEVSSPGVERPLVRRRDWQRFAGREVVVRGKRDLAEGTKRLQGTLLGLVGDPEGEDQVGLRLPDGVDVRIALADIEAANLVFQWGSSARRPG